MHRDACPEAEPHRFWDILELAHKVIEASSRQYQGRLAQINKYFWPIARQHLWKSIPRVDPLLDLVLRELGDKKVRNMDWLICLRLLTLRLGPLSS